MILGGLLNGSAIFQAASGLFSAEGLDAIVGGAPGGQAVPDDYAANPAAGSTDPPRRHRYGSAGGGHGVRLRPSPASGAKASTVRRALQYGGGADEHVGTTSLPPLVREFVVGGAEPGGTPAATAATLVDLFRDLHFVNATAAAVVPDLEAGAGLGLDAFEDASAATADALPLGIWLSVAVGALLFTLILFCVVGNLFVIFAVLMERDLRSRPQYYLIFSLAIADLLVGMIVTPLGAWATLNQAWHLGVTLCDFWISVDVLVCTSSILHLVAIALDRYWSITDIYYVQNRTPKRIFFMLLLIWVVSLLISLAPIFGWKDAQFVARVREQHVCLISQQISYQVFSTATAFYIPLCAIIVVYYKIMRAAKKRFRRERDRRTVSKAGSRPTVDDPTVALTSTGGAANWEAAGCGGSNGAIAAGGAGFRAKIVGVHKKSAPSLLSPREISPFDNSSAISCENGHFKTRYESTTIANNSTSDEEERGGGAAGGAVSATVASGASLAADSPTPTAACCCGGAFRVAHASPNSYSAHNNNNNSSLHHSVHNIKDDNNMENNNNNMGVYGSNFVIDNSNGNGNGNAALNHFTSGHLSNNNNNNNNNVCASSVMSLATAPSQSQSHLETQFTKKLNAKSLFVKRQSGGAGGGASGGGGTTAALVKRKKGGRTLKESTESRRERKAWRTLAIITGTFVACWTPFFLVSLYRPICACHIPPVVENVTQWLGYLNSALNPVIYTVFSMDFRMAFQRILKRMCLMKEF